jgi:hypothetical protein
MVATDQFSVANLTERQRRSPMRAKIFDSRNFAFWTFEKHHLLIANGAP